MTIKKMVNIIKNGVQRKSQLLEPNCRECWTILKMVKNEKEPQARTKL